MNDDHAHNPRETPDPNRPDRAQDSPLSDESLVRLALGELNELEAAAVRAGVDRSPSDRQRWEAIASTLKGLESARDSKELMQVSGAVIRRLAEATRGPLEASRGGALERLGERIATVVFDSWRAPALAGVRGTGQSRLVKIETDGVEIEVRIDRDETREMSVVAGEVRAEKAPLRLALRRLDSGLERSIGVATDGFFEFDAPWGAYSLRLQWAEADSVAVDFIEI